jgi:pilus assembly protein Flp/PilA
MLASICKQTQQRQEPPIMKTFCKQFWSDSRGQDLVEYALAAGMVAVAAVAAMPTLSTTVSTVFSKIGSIIQSSVT